MTSAVLARAIVPSMAADDDWDDLFDRLVDTRQLHPLEAAMARGLPEPRRATFVAGRMAIREAMQLAAEAGTMELADVAVLRTARGAPLLPDHVTGSITHKRTLAMATVAPRRDGLHHVGLDLERRPTADDPARPSIARKILTARESSTLEQLRGHEREAREHTLLHFALKEAVYKAIDPFVERYVRFTEVELDLRPDGVADVTLHLPELADSDVRVEARWQFEGEWIVAHACSFR